MPLGEHKGKDMEDVPASWLLWYRNASNAIGKPNTFNADVLAYIEDNLQGLQQELNKQKR